MNEYFKFIEYVSNNFIMIGGDLSNIEIEKAILTKEISKNLLKKYGFKTLKIYERWLLSNYLATDNEQIDDKFIFEMMEIGFDKDKSKIILDNIKNYKINIGDVKINDGSKYIIINYDDKRIKIRKVSRLKFLIDRFGFDNTINSCLRYISITPYTGQQLAIPQSHYDLLYNEYHVRNEGFASPFNSKLIEKKNGRFCSLFYDVDKELGSLGSFLSVKLTDYDGGWVVNPPYIESVINKMADHIINNLPKIIFIVVAYWMDLSGIKKLINIAKSYKVIDNPIFEDTSNFSEKKKTIKGNFKVLYIAIGEDVDITALDKFPRFDK